MPREIRKRPQARQADDLFPLDFETGRLVFTPVLRSTGQRLDLVVDYHSFPFYKAPGYHGIVQDLNSGKWYAVYGKPCSIPGCYCDAWAEEVPGPSTMTEQAPPTVADDEVAHRALAEGLAGALRTLFTIEGVKGIGQSVTVLTPDALPLDFLGFVERLRAGAIEPGEEMVLMTAPRAADAAASDIPS